MVLSWPPCWVALDVNTEPTLPMSAPVAHRPPVWSMNERIWLLTLPERGGAPKMMAS